MRISDQSLQSRLIPIYVAVVVVVDVAELTASSLAISTTTSAADRIPRTPSLRVWTEHSKNCKLLACIMHSRHESCFNQITQMFN